jgi:hypothetical protein
MGQYILKVPKPINSPGWTCWAAAIASYLDVTKILPGATLMSVQMRFMAQTEEETGALPETEFAGVFKSLGMTLEGPIANPGVTYAKIRQLLKTKGHVLLMEGLAANIGHTNVIYGVGVPTDNHFSVLNVGVPSHYDNRRFSKIVYPVYLAYRR